MRTLLLVDKDAKDKVGRINATLEKIKADYYGNVTYEIQPNWDFSNIPWIYYDEAAKGIDFSLINKITKEIYSEHHLEFDNVIFCVDPQNWQDGKIAIGGWNVGGKYNEYYVQIVKIMHSDEWLYKAFAMEIAHMWDDMCWLEKMVNLNKIAGMDFDYDVIHGENPKWGRDVRGTNQEKWTKTGYYTDYNFKPVIDAFLDQIVAALEVRKLKFELFKKGLQLRITILQKMIELYKQLRMLTKPKASPILIAELSGEGEGYDHHH